MLHVYTGLTEFPPLQQRLTIAWDPPPPRSKSIGHVFHASRIMLSNIPSIHSCSKLCHGPSLKHKYVYVYVNILVKSVCRNNALSLSCCANVSTQLQQRHSRWEIQTDRQ